MLVGIIIGICVMSIFGVIGSWCIEEDKETLGKILLGPCSWLLILGSTLGAYVVMLIVPKKIRKKDLENLPHFYKMLGKSWCLCRVYGHRETNPFFYHWLVLMRVKIIEDKPIKKMC